MALKAYYIKVKRETVRVQADSKRSAMTEFHRMGYLAVWKDVKVVPAWEKDKIEKPPGCADLNG